MFELLQMPNCGADALVTDSTLVPAEEETGLALVAGLVPGGVLLLLSIFLLLSPRAHARLRGRMTLAMSMLLGLYPLTRFLLSLLACGRIVAQQTLSTLLPGVNIVLLVAMAAMVVLLVVSWRALARLGR